MLDMGSRCLTVCALVLGLLMRFEGAAAHGGVVLEEDLCVINVGYLRGHFKIYLPRTRRHQEYCEDLPEATETVFVMEYLHGGLGNMAVDFRIIEDVTGLGRFVRWTDVEKIDDLDAVTVFYQAPAVEPDVFSVVHEFEREGTFVGIVTARDPGTQRRYVSVFPFEIGFTGFGNAWQLFLALLISVQLGYWVMTGRFARWRQRIQDALHDRRAER
jgi:hypothetical protein